MNDFLDDLQTVVRKELLYIFRVPDVLIFSVLIPMVLYPVLMIGAGVYSAWAVANQQKQIYKIAIFEDQSESLKHVVAVLKATGRIKFVPQKNPDDAVRKETVIASCMYAAGQQRIGSPLRWRLLILNRACSFHSGNFGV